MAKKIFEFKNITICVEASNEEVAKKRLEARLERLKNRDVTYKFEEEAKVDD